MKKLSTLQKVLFTSLMFCAGVSSAFASVLYTQGARDGMIGRDWYSNPNYYWVTNDAQTVDIYHSGSDRWLLRGLVIIDISSLGGTTLAPNSANFNFYSFGFSGVQLQYGGSTGSEVVPGYGQIGGASIAVLDDSVGWKSFDVTSYVQSGIDASYQNIGFVFNATVNYGGGSLAASEDAQGRGAFLQVGSEPTGTVPEPATMLLLGLGLIGLAGVRSKLEK